MFVPWLEEERHICFLSVSHGSLRNDIEQATRLADFSNHLRIYNPHESRALSWKSSEGVVHITEVMINIHWGIDRVTRCRQLRLNKNPQDYPAWVLDIVPCVEGVTCLGCLAAA